MSEIKPTTITDIFGLCRIFEHTARITRYGSLRGQTRVIHVLSFAGAVAVLRGEGSQDPGVGSPRPQGLGPGAGPRLRRRSVRLPLRGKSRRKRRFYVTYMYI